MTNQPQTVTTDTNDQIRANAERGVAKWTEALEQARKGGSSEQIAAIEQALAFWTRTAGRDHTGRTVR